jgi:hypothetical protein
MINLICKTILRFCIQNKNIYRQYSYLKPLHHI